MTEINYFPVANISVEEYFHEGSFAHEKLDDGFFSPRHLTVTFRTLIQYFLALTRQCRIIVTDKVGIITKNSATATITIPVVGRLSLPRLVTK